MNYKVNLFTVLVVFFGTISCQKEQNTITEVIKEKIVLKDAIVFDKKPKNIIFLIGDGMGISQITAANTRNKDFLHLARCKHIGFSKTNSTKYITDSAAGATAFSIGKKTFNGSIGLDKDSIPHKTILEIAEENKLATGMVSTSTITHATPASFIAHQPSRKMYEEIALDFLKTDIDVFIGGGKNHFTTRKDGKDLTVDLKNNGYELIYSLEQLKETKSLKIAALLADDGMPTMSEGRGNMLEKSSLKAIEVLSKNEKGFFLMIEGSQIDWGGHDNNSEYIIEEMIDFDNVIGNILDFADKNKETLVVITADHETGGYALVEGDLVTGNIEGRFSTDYHTGTMVPVFAYGPGAEAFMGIYHNTSIYDKFMKLFGFN